MFDTPFGKVGFAIFFGGGERPVAASVRWESDASSLRMMRRFIPLTDG